MAKILARKGQETIPLKLPQNRLFIIGRGKDCNLRVRLKTVSRKHTQIRYENGQYFITDLGTSNGTFVNEQKIVEAALKHGDKIRISKMELVFVLDEEEQKAASALAAEKPDLGSEDLDDMEVTADVNMTELLASLPDASEYTADLPMDQLLAEAGVMPISQRKRYLALAAVAAGLLLLVLLIALVIKSATQGQDTIRPEFYHLTVDDNKICNVPYYHSLLVTDPRIIDVKEFKSHHKLQILALSPGQAQVLLKQKRGTVFKKLVFEVHRDVFAEACIQIQKQYQQLSELQLQDEAQKLYERATVLFEQRKVEPGYLYNARMALHKAICILELIEGIKPPLYKKIEANQKIYKEELDNLYRKHWFNFRRAEKLRQWEIVKDELIHLMKMIPNRRDRHYQQARRYYERYLRARYYKED